ncbi:MAG TPA: Nudix family hydrolase [Gammaproteobacteria bacterium]
MRRRKPSEARFAVVMTSQRIHVVAGVLTDPRGRVLLSRRPADAHQGGLWEFPGGKVEDQEMPETALRRELEEELGVTVKAARPLIRIPFDYPDRRVLLDVWRVTRWQDGPRAVEQQELDWVAPEKLRQRAMPAADVPVVNAVRLPSCYAITPSAEDFDSFLGQMEALAQGPAGMIQLRAHELDDASYASLARACASICERNGATLILNCEPGRVPSLGAQGVHLTSRRLDAMRARPLGSGYWVGASCHGADELATARRLGLDFAVLSPVAPTPSHPYRSPLGWDGFQRLVRDAGLPVYALGGVDMADLDTCWQCGAQGIAGIRAFWPA